MVGGKRKILQSSRAGFAKVFSNDLPGRCLTQPSSWSFSNRRTRPLSPALPLTRDRDTSCTRIKSNPLGSMAASIRHSSEWSGCRNASRSIASSTEFGRVRLDETVNPSVVQSAQRADRCHSLSSSLFRGRTRLSILTRWSNGTRGTRYFERRTARFSCTCRPTKPWMTIALSGSMAAPRSSRLHAGPEEFGIEWR